MRNTLHESSNSVSTCENMKKTGIIARNVRICRHDVFDAKLQLDEVMDHVNIKAHPKLNPNLKP